MLGFKCSVCSLFLTAIRRKKTTQGSAAEGLISKMKSNQQLSLLSSV